MTETGNNIKYSNEMSVRETTVKPVQTELHAHFNN